MTTGLAAVATTAALVGETAMTVGASAVVTGPTIIELPEQAEKRAAAPLSCTILMIRMTAPSGRALDSRVVRQTGRAMILNARDGAVEQVSGNGAKAVGSSL